MSMLMRHNVVVAAFLILIGGLSHDLTAAGAGKEVARGVARRLATKTVDRAATRGVGTTLASKAPRPTPMILKMDRLRDSQIPIMRLTRPRSVYRYTTSAQANTYRRNGVPSGVHFTVKAGPGRPLTSISAKERYGLPRIPTARVEVILPKGATVKAGKVIGGQAGYGELKTYRRPLPPSTVQAVVPIQK
jgi:hypothetical protein